MIIFGKEGENITKRSCSHKCFLGDVEWQWDRPRHSSEVGFLTWGRCLGSWWPQPLSHSAALLYEASTTWTGDMVVVGLRKKYCLGGKFKHWSKAPRNVLHKAGVNVIQILALFLHGFDFSVCRLISHVKFLIIIRNSCPSLTPL